MDVPNRPAIDFQPLWDAFGTEFGLLPELALDAVLARYRQGEPACIPRIIELVCSRSVTVTESAAALRVLDLEPLSSTQRRMVESVLDRWWLLALSVPNENGGVTDTLGILAGFGASVQRWLHVWLENFDGLGASLFVEAVLGYNDDLPASGAWLDKQDEWTQFRQWCRSEPTVMGFTLLGGSHVRDSEMTAVLELIV